VSNDPPRLATVPWTATCRDLSICVWKLSSQTHHNNCLLLATSIQNSCAELQTRYHR